MVGGREVWRSGGLEVGRSGGRVVGGLEVGGLEVWRFGGSTSLHATGRAGYRGNSDLIEKYKFQGNKSIVRKCGPCVSCSTPSKIIPQFAAGNPAKHNSNSTIPGVETQ